MDRRLVLAFAAALIVILFLGFWTRQNHAFNVVGTSSERSTTDGICLDGCPSGAPADDQIVTHHVLILANNPNTKFADWVAYRITKDTLGTHCKRHWERDPDIAGDNTLNPSDYIGIRAALQSDRGHQAPLASLCGSPYWQEADYLSNITPQKADLNEGAWERLENAERALIFRGFGSVYSITGPLYERLMPPLPKTHTSIEVPSAYWKVISVDHSGAILTVGFLMDQETPRDADFCAKLIGLGEIERRTHLTFFAALTVDERKKIETNDNSGDLGRALGC